jgi:G3E family GTPase
LATRIKGFRRELDPEFLFIEPSEMVVTRELRNASAMGLRDIKYDIGPFITLVDGPSFDFSWQERKALLLGQIKDADLVVVSRTDLINSERLAEIGGVLKVHCNGVLGLSTHFGQGIEEVVEMVEKFSQP